MILHPARDAPVHGAELALRGRALHFEILGERIQIQIIGLVGAGDAYGELDGLHLVDVCVVDAGDHVGLGRRRAEKQSQSGKQALHQIFSRCRFE